MPWFVAKIKPGKMQLAETHLRQQRFRLFIPMMKQRRDGEWKEMIMFPGYIFVQLSMRDRKWRRINGTRGVKCLLGNDPETPIAVPEKFVIDLKSIAYTEDFDRKYLIGDKVKINDGAFAGHSGSVVAASMRRITLLLKVLGGETKVHIDTRKVSLE